MIDHEHTLEKGYLQPEKPTQEGIVLSTRLEKRAVYAAATERLSRGTRIELDAHIISIGTPLKVDGPFRKKEAAKNDALRVVVKKLAVDLGIEHSYEDCLYLGLYDSIPEKTLNEWANPPKPLHWSDEGYNKHTFAKYFWEKKLAAEAKERRKISFGKAFP